MKNVSFRLKYLPFQLFPAQAKKKNKRQKHDLAKTFLFKKKGHRRTESDSGGGGLEVDPEGHPAEYCDEGAWNVRLQQEETQVPLQ